MKWQNAVGSIVWDEHGREYIDFTSGGIFTANIGNSNLAVKYAICDCLYHNLLSSYTYKTDIRKRYIKKLLEVTGFDACALFCSGCEAVEAALRVMRGRNKHRQAVLWVEGNFHGRTQGAAMRMYTWMMPWPKPNDLLELPMMAPVCGIILESYRGWDARFYPEDFIQKIRQLCDDHDLLLCMDEVQAGFGRTGKFWGYEHYAEVEINAKGDIEIATCKPDLICFGKAAGGGLPVSGLLGAAGLLELADLTSTHGGHPLGCAAGLAVLDEIEKRDLVAESARKGELLHKWLREEMPDVKIQGRGMVAALIFRSPDVAGRVVNQCRGKGLLVVHTGKSSVKLGPPLIISDEDLCKGLEILKEVVNEHK